MQIRQGGFKRQAPMYMCTHVTNWHLWTGLAFRLQQTFTRFCWSSCEGLAAPSECWVLRRASSLPVAVVGSWWCQLGATCLVLLVWCPLDFDFNASVHPSTCHQWHCQQQFLSILSAPRRRWIASLAVHCSALSSSQQISRVCFCFLPGTSYLELVAKRSTVLIQHTELRGLKRN